MPRWTTRPSPAATTPDASGTLTFTGNETAETITITIQNDIRAEEIEQFSVQLSNPSGGTLDSSSATITINDDDYAAFLPFIINKAP
jgi:hypothetical protein